jgi:uncharacterized RDD family membrane protein YckC
MTEPSDPNEGYRPPPSSSPPDFTKPSDPAPSYPPPASPPPGFPPPDSPPPAPGYGSAAGFPPAPTPQPGYGYGAPSPTPAPPGMVADPNSGLFIPQGTELASVGRRIGAFFLSGVLLIVTLIIGYVIWGLIAWGKGTTPAMQVLGMRAWKPQGNRIATFGDMALREVVGRFLLDLVPFAQLVSFILFLASGKRQALHDLVAGTVVLYDPNKVIPS